MARRKWEASLCSWQNTLFMSQINASSLHLLHLPEILWYVTTRPVFCDLHDYTWHIPTVVLNSEWTAGFGAFLQIIHPDKKKFHHYGSWTLITVMQVKPYHKNFDPAQIFNNLLFKTHFIPCISTYISYIISSQIFHIKLSKLVNWPTYLITFDFTVAAMTYMF